MSARRLALGVLGLGAGALTAGAVVVYLQREAIGVTLAFDYLKAHGVPAAIRLDRLDLGGVAGQVRLGPPGRPDLTIGRLEARLGSLPSPWRGVRPPPVRSLTLIQPVLHGRWRDGRLDFGTLQPLIDQALSAKPTGAPAPDLYVRDGRLELDTPSGPLRLSLDLAVQGGLVRSLHVRLAPADLHGFGLHLSGVQGVLSGEATARGGLHLSGAFAAARGEGRQGGGAGLVLTAEVLTPNGPADGPTAAPRPLDAIVRLKAPRFTLTPDVGAPIDVRDADVSLDVDGLVDRRGGFSGRMQAHGHAARLSRAGLELAATALGLQSSGAQVDPSALGGATVQGPFTLALSSAGGRLQVGETRAALQALELRSDGRLAIQGRRVTARATGALAGGARLADGEAAALAHRAVGGVDVGLEQTLARSLRQVRLTAPDFAASYDGGRGLQLRLPQGVRGEVAGGSVALSPSAGAPMLETSARGTLSGAFGLAVNVSGLPRTTLQASRYDLSPAGELRLATRLSVRGDLAAVRGGALEVAGDITGRRDRWTLKTEGCAHLSALAVRSGHQALASGVRADVCPDPAAPLASMAAGRWRLRAQLRQAAAALPGAELAVQIADADVAAQGDRRGPSARVSLKGLAVQDTAPVARLRPVSATGALTLIDGGLKGRLALTLAQGATELGILSLDARMATGEGSAVFDSGRLAFAEKGLQPGDVAPALKAVLPQAQGELQALALFGWTRAGLVSSGELRSDGFSFKSPAGRLDGVRGDVRLASLSPLLSAPDQTVTADRLETVIPLEHLQADFTLGAQALQLRAASAQAAAGRLSLDPMRLPLAGPLATSSVLRLQGVDLQRLIDALNLSHAVSLQAKVDGTLPFSLQPAAGRTTALRLSQGRVFAVAPGRLTIERQALTGAVSSAGGGAQPSAVQDFAYQALEDLAFSTLEAKVASRPGGRLGVVFHVVGRHDPKVDRPTRIGLFALLRGHAFDKPLPLPKGTPVDLTLDTSLNLDDILAAYGALGASTGSAKVQP